MGGLATLTSGKLANQGFHLENGQNGGGNLQAVREVETRDG